MSEPFSMDLTGLDPLLQLPDTLRDALRNNAHASAQRIHDHARRELIAQQKTQARKLADNIKILDEPEQERVAVVSFPPIGQPTNVTIWNEHGTSRMSARPYMRPAAEAERDRYLRETTAAIERVVGTVK